MNLIFSPKPAATFAKTHIAVEFLEKSPLILREERGVQTLVIGREEQKSISKHAFRQQVRSIVRAAKQSKIERLVLDANAILSEKVLSVLSREQALEEIAYNLQVAHYEFSRYKTSKTKERYAHDVVIAGISRKADIAALERGTIIAEYVNKVRDLANTPGGDMTPEALAEGARRAAKGLKIAVTVLDKKGIEKEKMGALLGVARGSTLPPRFIIMEYWGKGKGKEAPIVFVGKGITFDTGGLNLKPSDAVLDMHLDMSGGAVVIGAICCAARLGIPKNIVALIPAAENMVSGESYRPGDVLTTMSGKTVDVLNTDAEGRLVLADGLTYARKYQPRLVIDVATLTGAALVALGQHASAIMTKDRNLQDILMRLGEESGDHVWPLPLWDVYKQYTKGVFGDIANIPTSHSRYGGCINGGMFLSHFTEGMTWAHIDMSPRMTAAASDQLAKGATGEPMRLLLALAEEF